MLLNKYVNVSDEVYEAVKANKPVVALESTIISHGMPYPDNVKTALSLEEIIRKEGAVPATIGIIDGVVQVGLTKEQVEFLGTAKGVAKVSRRDMPFVIAKGLNGATTVASTMICANFAGIKFFATGGVGGVHRKAQETFDISADLEELSNTDVVVISSGVKSILDIGLTLEVLETLGVTTVSYKSDEFPAFYTRKSGFSADYRCDAPDEIAKAVKAKWDLGLKGGMIIGNPVPEESEIDSDLINDAIKKALKEAEDLGVKGKKVTPFLLSKIKDLTEGASLKTNIALVENNAKLGAQIAVKYFENK